MTTAKRSILRVRALIEKDNYILLARITKTAIYFLPGGRLEPGEGILAGLKRELLEESGVEIENIMAAGVQEQFWTERGEYIHEINFLFKGTLRLLPSEKAIATNDEDVELVWVKRDQVGEINLKPEGILELFKIPKEGLGLFGVLC